MNMKLLIGLLTRGVTLVAIGFVLLVVSPDPLT